MSSKAHNFSNGGIDNPLGGDGNFLPEKDVSRLLFVNYRKSFGDKMLDLTKKEKEEDVSKEEDFSDVVFFTINPEVDKQLHGLFFQINEYNLSPHRKLKEKERYYFLLERLKGLVARLSPEEQLQFAETYNTLIGLERQRFISNKIYHTVTQRKDPKYNELLKNWDNKAKELGAKFQRGEVSREEYFAELDKINGKVVDDTDDKELEDLWKEYQEEKSISFEKLMEDQHVVVKTDKPVKSKDVVKGAFQAVGKTGMDVNVSDNGSATVMLGDQFPVEVSVYRSDEDEFVYYFADQYAENGVIRVKAADLIPELDKRHIDAYLSKKIGKQLIDDYESVGEIPDRDLIQLGERLLLPGKDRNYQIVGEERRILDALVKVLVQPSEKYPTFYYKIRELNRYFLKRDNVHYVRNRFLRGEIEPIEKLVS